MNFLLFLLISLLFTIKVNSFNLFDLFEETEDFDKKKEDFNKKNNQIGIFYLFILAECVNYLCPNTLKCVDLPINCPCFDKNQKKCIVNDWYICTDVNNHCL